TGLGIARDGATPRMKSQPREAMAAWFGLTEQQVRLLPVPEPEGNAWHETMHGRVGVGFRVGENVINPGREGRVLVVAATRDGVTGHVRVGRTNLLARAVLAVIGAAAVNPEGFGSGCAGQDRGRVVVERLLPGSFLSRILTLGTVRAPQAQA